MVCIGLQSFWYKKNALYLPNSVLYLILDSVILLATLFLSVLYKPFALASAVWSMDQELWIGNWSRGLHLEWDETLGRESGSFLELKNMQRFFRCKIVQKSAKMCKSSIRSQQSSNIYNFIFSSLYLSSMSTIEILSTYYIDWLHRCILLCYRIAFKSITMFLIVFLAEFKLIHFTLFRLFQRK